MSRRVHVAAMAIAVAGMIGSLGVAVTPAAHSQSTEKVSDRSVTEWSMNERPEPCWLVGLHSPRTRECRSAGWVIERRLWSDPTGHAWTTLRPCEQEDGRRCYWNARVQGNGYGTSFVNVPGHGRFYGFRSINGVRS